MVQDNGIQFQVFVMGSSRGSVRRTEPGTVRCGAHVKGV